MTQSHYSFNFQLSKRHLARYPSKVFIFADMPILAFADMVILQILDGAESRNIEYHLGPKYQISELVEIRQICYPCTLSWTETKAMYKSSVGP